MLKTLRSNTKWIMITVSLCFIGMIIFAWGMDITGRRSGMPSGILGRINGEKIPYTLYDNLVKSRRQMYSENTRITLAQERRIYDEVWDYIVNQTLIAHDIKKYNISYTDQELVQFMLNNPIQLAPQIPMFQENNAFSLTKYQDFLKNPANLQNPQNAQLLSYIESEASNSLPIYKFQEKLTDTVVVTDAQVRERWLRENEKRKAEWVFINAGSLTQIATTLNPEDVQTYFEKHKEDYKRGERRVLDAVFFELAPTAKDSSDVLERAKLLVSRIRNGENFEELANEYSDDPGNIDSSGNRRGGDLGFFGRGRMIPEFEEAAFSLKPGEVSDPVLTQFGYHIIRVDSLRYKEDNKEEIDQVKARHILFNIEPSGETHDKVENTVTAFTESINGGMDFMAQAQLDSLDVIHTFPFQKDAINITPITGSSKLLVLRAFRAKKGELLPLFEIDGGYYIMRVAEILAAGIPSLNEVRVEVENDVRKSIRIQYSQDIVYQINKRLGEGKSLTEAVEADSVQIAHVQTAEVTRNQFISGLGNMNTFFAKIFKLENPGDTTGPVVTDSGSGIAVLLEKIPVDEEKYEKERSELASRIENELKSEIISVYMTQLREKAEIVDNRDMFVGL